MKINFFQKNITLSDAQKDYVQSKFTSLKHKYKVLEDESALVKVDVEFFESKTDKRHIFMAANVAVPGGAFRAEEHALTVEEGIDQIEDKLKMQLEKFKELHQA